MRKKVSIKGVDQDALEMLSELRAEEQRFMGAIVSDAIRMYWDSVFDNELPDEGDPEVAEAA